MLRWLKRLRRTSKRDLWAGLSLISLGTSDGGQQTMGKPKRVNIDLSVFSLEGDIGDSNLSVNAGDHHIVLLSAQWAVALVPNDAKRLRDLIDEWLEATPTRMERAND